MVEIPDNLMKFVHVSFLEYFIAEDCLLLAFTRKQNSRSMIDYSLKI
jgi:hypothetical protein